MRNGETLSNKNEVNEFEQNKILCICIWTSGRLRRTRW